MNCKRILILQGLGGSSPSERAKFFTRYEFNFAVNLCNFAIYL